MMKKLILSSCIFFISPLCAEEPNDLDELLEQVRNERTLQKEQFLERESKFKNAHSKQKELLKTHLTFQQKLSLYNKQYEYKALKEKGIY